MRLVLATRNDHKLRELRQLMAPIELDELPEEVALPPETGGVDEDEQLAFGGSSALIARGASAAIDWNPD